MRPEVVGWSLLILEGGLFGLFTDEHPARNAFTGACQIIHHIHGCTSRVVILVVVTWQPAAFDPMGPLLPVWARRLQLLFHPCILTLGPVLYLPWPLHAK